MLLTFTSSHRSIQSIPTKDSHCSKETDLPPGAPIKIYQFYSHSACCNWSFDFLPGRTCWGFVFISETSLMIARVKIPKHMYILWGKQHSFNGAFKLISLLIVIRSIRKIHNIPENRYVTWWHGLLFGFLVQLMCSNYSTEKIYQQQKDKCAGSLLVLNYCAVKVEGRKVESCVPVKCLETQDISFLVLQTTRNRDCKYCFVSLKFMRINSFRQFVSSFGWDLWG